MVQGIDRIRFTLPTQYDGNQNEGIQIGYVKVSVNGGGIQDFIKWGLGNNYNELDENIRIKTFFDGECFIYTNGRSKFIVHPNYEIKISRDKFKVINFITATKAKDKKEFNGKRYIKIEADRQP